MKANHLYYIKISDSVFIMAGNWIGRQPDWTDFRCLDLLWLYFKIRLKKKNIFFSVFNENLG